MQTLEPILAEQKFFSGLTPSDLELLARCASNVRFDADQMLLKEGEEANDFYLIREGTVALELFLPERGPVVLQTLGAGDVLGWSWLIPPYRWRFDARATERTRCLAFDGKCLRTKFEENPRLGYELLQRVARVFADRLIATRLQLLDVYGKPS